MQRLFASIQEDIILKIGKIFKQKLFTDDEDEKTVDFDLLNSLRKNVLTYFFEKGKLKTYFRGQIF